MQRRASGGVKSALEQAAAAAAFVLIPLVLGASARHLHVPIVALGAHFVGSLLVETLVLSRYVRGHAGKATATPPFHRDALRILRTGVLARLFALGGGIAGGALALAACLVTGRSSEALVGLGLGLGVLLTDAVTIYATRLTVLAEVGPLSALRRSVRVAGRNPVATAAAFLALGAVYVLALAGAHFFVLAALAMGVRWLRDVQVTRLALAPAAPSQPSASFAGLSVGLLVALVSLGSGDASAQVPLLVSGSDPGASGSTTGTGTRLITPSPAPVAAAGSSVIGAHADTITPVILARSNVDAAFVRRQQALDAMREAVIHGGDRLAAEAEVTASEQALRDATAGVRTALEANEAATQLAVKREQLAVNGAEGTTTLASASMAAGLTVGMGQGTAVGAWDSLLGLGHAVLHPIDTGKALVSAFTQPPLTHDQEIAHDVIALQQERADRLATVDAPFDSSRKAGYLLGHDVVGPLVAGEVLGGVGSVAGRALGRVSKTESALVDGATQTVARAPYKIDVTGLEQSAGPRPILTYSSDTPVFRVQDPGLPLTPHPSEYFDNSHYGLPSIIEKADGTRAFQSWDALFVSTDMKELTLLRQQQGYFEQGATLHSSTLGELLEGAGPNARVFVDQRLSSHSLIIAAPPK